MAGSEGKWNLLCVVRGYNVYKDVHVGSVSVTKTSTAAGCSFAEILRKNTRKNIQRHNAKLPVSVG